MGNPTRTVFECDLEFLPTLESWKKLLNKKGFTIRARLQPLISSDIEHLKKVPDETQNLKTSGSSR